MRQPNTNMRQGAALADERFMVVRSLSVDYERGSAQPTHQHPWSQLLYASRGTLRATIGRGVWLVPPRRAVWIPANCPHQLTMLGPLELRTLYFQEHGLPGSQEVRVVDVSGLLHELVLRTCSLAWLDERDWYQHSLAKMLAAELMQGQGHSVFLVLPTDRRAAELARIMLNAGRDGIDLDLALEAAGMSRRTAERLFVAETGLSPARWYRLARLVRGLEHLIDGGSVTEAAWVAGYESLAAFGDLFLKTFGVTPGFVRKQRGS